MIRFLKGLSSVVIALFLALGWTWTDYLRQQGYINDYQRGQILIVITVLLTLQQIYLVLPKPVGRGVIEARRKIIQEYYLKNLHAECYKVLTSHQHDKSKPLATIRINIMLPTKPLKGLLGTHLKIYYYVCHNGVIYSGQELGLKWGRNNGTCGWAWKSGDISIYDSENPEFQMPGQLLNNKQHTIVKGIKSTLSVPIWYNDNVIGVLNLDSKQNITDTLFDQDSIYTLVSACAKVVSDLCFNDGVAP
jgi:hypothetical protein